MDTLCLAKWVMDINNKEMKNILKNKEIYYSKAYEYFKALNLEEDEVEIDMTSLLIEKKSIVYVVHHNMISSDSIGITLDLFVKYNVFPVGYYTLYVDTEMNFIDEFFVLH